MQNRYPLWKNLMLLGLFVIGLIYALPNIYPVDPAVQISVTGENAKLDKNTLDKITLVLGEANLKASQTEQHPESLLLRFSDTENQIKARDIIKATLGNDFSVALNLASRTPHWLEVIGAYPMKLGLDLRGGVNFLEEVDTNSLIKAREDGDMRSISDILREANIRYSGMDRLQSRGLSINFRDEKALNKAFTELKNHLPDYTFNQINNAETREYKLQVIMSEAVALKVAEYAIDQTMNTLRNRVNELGVSEAIVQRQGANHISIDLPGIQDTARAKELIGKQASLRFQLLDVEHDAESVAMSGDIPLGSKLYKYEGHNVLLKERVILQGDSITYAAASYSQEGRPAVSVHLGGGGESIFHRVTSENVGKPMAVVYIEPITEQKVVDGKVVTTTHTEEKVINVATIQSALGNNFEITGLANEKFARDLALLLRSGALVAPVVIVQELTVGPSMGKDNIHKGLVSVVFGFALIVLFMAFYYRIFGLIANTALFLNLIFIVAIQSILGATLTLPGIAAIVLTVGMAVDANVLIYERIREELRNGNTVQASIHAGYERAFTTIVDSNMTTLIVAIVMFALGTGAIKGFSVVLIIGLATSMVTSIVFTRAIVNLLYGRKNIKHLPIGMKVIN